MTGHAKKFEFNLTRYFKFSDKKFFKKYNQVQKRIEKSLEIKFDRKPVYVNDEKYRKKSM